MSENQHATTEPLPSQTPAEQNMSPVEQVQQPKEKELIWVTPMMPKAKEMLEFIGKLMLGLAGLSYTLGLIIMNLHLYKYGVYSLNLLRLNYVIAGFWSLVPVIVWLLIAVKVSWLLLYYNKKFCAFYNLPTLNGSLTRDDKKLIRAELLLVFIVVVAVILIVYFTIGFQLNWLNPIVVAGLLSGSIVHLSLTAMTFSRALLSRVYLRVSSFILVSLATITYIVAFALAMYGSIPSHLGGGAPKEIIIVFAEDFETKKLLDIAGFSFFTNSTQMASARLLFATEEEYILLPNDRDISLSVPRGSVKAVFYSVKIERRAAENQMPDK